jgi:hypothetical protein
MSQRNLRKENQDCATVLTAEQLRFRFGLDEKRIRLGPNERFNGIALASHSADDCYLLAADNPSRATPSLTPVFVCKHNFVIRWKSIIKGFMFRVLPAKLIRPKMNIVCSRRDFA